MNQLSCLTFVEKANLITDELIIGLDLFKNEIPLYFKWIILIGCIFLCFTIIGIIIKVLTRIRI